MKNGSLQMAKNKMNLMYDAATADDVLFKSQSTPPDQS